MCSTTVAAPADGVKAVDPLASWGVVGTGGQRAARSTLFEYGPATRAQDPAASGVRLGEAGLRPAGAEPPSDARMRWRGLEPPRPKAATRPSTWRVYQFRHQRPPPHSSGQPPRSDARGIARPGALLGLHGRLPTAKAGSKRSRPWRAGSGRSVRCYDRAAGAAGASNRSADASVVPGSDARWRGLRVRPLTTGVPGRGRSSSCRTAPQRPRSAV
jgi:hypothetical protein